MSRMLPGATLELTRDEWDAPVEVTAERSQGWGELMLVSRQDPGEAREYALIVYKPSGKWWMLKDFAPLNVIDDALEEKPDDGT